MFSFLEEHFDKLLLFLMFAIMLTATLHMSHDVSDSAAVNWAREATSLILGALIGLITGMSIRNNKKP